MARYRVSNQRRVRLARQELELAAAEVLFWAERWTLTGRTLADLRNDRTELLQSARRYGKAILRVR